MTGDLVVGLKKKILVRLGKLKMTSENIAYDQDYWTSPVVTRGIGVRDGVKVLLKC